LVPAKAQGNFGVSLTRGFGVLPPAVTRVN